MNNKGQSTIEYAIIIGLVVAGLTAMQVYIKRGIQATIRVAADELGNQEDAETNPQQGTPADSTDSEINTQTTGTKRVKLFTGGSREIFVDKTATSSGETEYISWRQK